MKSRYTKKLFPFSPGIPWTIKNNKYIIPEINALIWDRVLGDKDFVVTCYGGFMESFFSLCYCEAIAAVFPEKSITWMGYNDFHQVVKLQGIAKINPFSLGQSTVSKYPAPIFMDAANNAYFNVLNNYIETSSFKLTKPIYNKDFILKQIYQNCMIPWDNYLPIIRQNNDKYITWAKNNKFYDNKKYIVVFNKSWKTMHQEQCLLWSDQQVRELAALVRHMGISVVGIGFKNISSYYNSDVICAPMDVEIMIGLIEKSYAVLSRDVDNIMIAMSLSKSSIIMSREVDNIFDFYENAEFFGAQNVIFIDRELQPIDVYKFLEGL